MGKFKMTELLRLMKIGDMIVLPAEAYNSARTTRDVLQKKNLGKWTIQRKNGVTIQRINAEIPDEYMDILKDKIYEEGDGKVMIEAKYNYLLLVAEGEIVSDVETLTYEDAPDEYNLLSSVFTGDIFILDEEYGVCIYDQKTNINII